MRVARHGLPALHVPGAEAVHLYAQSAFQEPRAAGWFAESARRFREIHYSAWFADLLEFLDRRLPDPRPAPLAAVPAAGLDLAGWRFPLWVEVSPNATGFPAAAERLTSPPADGWRLPDEVAARLPAGDLVVQVVDEAGRELARYLLPGAEA